MKILDINGVSTLWRRIKETFARKSETVSDISRDDTTFTVTKADGTTFEFTQKDTTYDVATTTTAGLMSAADKAKLNDVESGAQENVIESVSVNGADVQIVGKGVDIIVPTALSSLVDDVGYLTEESDPTVPGWAKQPQKPTYTAFEVGALSADTHIPDKVSELVNDAGYLTQHQDISGKANIVDLSAVATSGSYADLTGTPTIPVVPTKVSAFTNDASYTNEKYVDDAITAALADVVGIEYHVCTADEYDAQTYIPTLAGEAGVIYLVPKPMPATGSTTVETDTTSENNIYYEFIYSGQSFEMIGDTQVGLDGYLEDSDISTDTEVQSVIKDVFAKKFTVYFYNGSTLITQQLVISGEDATYSGSTPTKTQDAQYTYSFAGWSMDDDNTVDSDALTAVTADRNVYACFSQTLRKYTVTFVRSTNDGGGTLQTINNVDYGTTITAASAYTGTTPTTTQGSAEDYPFEGWTPASATVQGDTTFTAKFGGAVEVKEITDSWETILANENYATDYSIGDTKYLDLGTEGKHLMEIVAFDTDDKADGTGKAGITWISKTLLNTNHRMNPQKASNTEGTGALGGWEKCELRAYLKNTIKPLISETVRNGIIEVTKHQAAYDASTETRYQQTSTEDVWIPSYRELYNKTTYEETSGPIYSAKFTDNASRKKSTHHKPDGIGTTYWMRTASGAANYKYVTGTGGDAGNSSHNSEFIAIGFCTN